MSAERIEGTTVTVVIEYCIGCKWMLRAAWLAQELLSTFEDSLHQVSLRPIKSPAGTFKIYLNDELIWDRKLNNGFPESKELKAIVRNKAWPQRDLGHIDRHSNKQQ
jgi:selenoprotein W-related protein